MFNLFNKETSMSNDVENDILNVEDIERCEGRCHHKVNLCDTVAYQFGRVECLVHPYIPLRTAGNTYLGYAVNEGKATYLKVVWEGEANEVLVILRNGEPVEFIQIDGTDEGTKCVKLRERYCDCDVINILEVPAGCQTPEEVESQIVGEFKPACSISAVIEFEPDCKERFKREGDGVFEAYIGDGSSVSIPTTWSPVGFDQVRINTIPGYISFNGTDVALKEGVYKVDYAMTIETQTSTSLNFKGKLVVDGADYPSSFSADHILAGQGGDVSLAQGVIVKVDRGQVVHLHLEAITDVDSSINGDADANIIVERIANSIDL